MSGSCVDENALLMSEVRVEWADWLEMIESQVNQATFIYITLVTIQIVSKQLHNIKIAKTVCQ